MSRIYAHLVQGFTPYLITDVSLPVPKDTTRKATSANHVSHLACHVLMRLLVLIACQEKSLEQTVLAN